MLSDHVLDLDLQVDRCELSRRERDTSSGFARVTTIVSLHGDGAVGRGEDVTYTNEAHDRLQERGIDIPTDIETFGEFSTALAGVEFFPDEAPEQSVFRNYRRWAFESAALDLALRQAGESLGSHLGRAYDPVRFVVSTRLADPPTGDRVIDWLDRNPDLEFKLDPTPEWPPEVIDRLAATDAVRILDLKGKYEGTEVDQPPDPGLYERVLRGFPDALVEDPALTEETRPLFDGHEGRVTWDYPVKSVESIHNLPWEPEWLNIKPSRFGSVRSLFDSIDYCLDRGIRMYGGGQFELGVGREHLHTIASLFYPDSPNDVAPGGYNDPDPQSGLPTSPLSPPDSPQGLSWD